MPVSKRGMFHVGCHAGDSHEWLTNKWTVLIAKAETVKAIKIQIESKKRARIWPIALYLDSHISP